MPLPPGLNAAAFESALKAFAAIVGAEWAISRAEALQPYADPYSPGLAADYQPSGVVLPASVDEDQGGARCRRCCR